MAHFELHRDGKVRIRLEKEPHGRAEVKPDRYIDDDVDVEVVERP